MKEDFCPPCLAAIPLAFAATGAGATQIIDGKEVQQSPDIGKIVLIIILSIISSIIFYYIFKAIFKAIFSCKTCK